MGVLGGYRPGSGRPKKEYEINVRELAVQAIEQHYGGIKEGFIHLLNSGEPALVKFCWEHGVGKPTDKIEMSVEQDIKTIEIIQLPDNGRDNFIEPIDEIIEPTV